MSVSLWGLELFREFRHLTLGGCNSCPWGAIICFVVLASFCCGCCGFIAGLLAGSRWLRNLVIGILRHLIGPGIVIPAGTSGGVLGRRLAQYRRDS